MLVGLVAVLCCSEYPASLEGGWEGPCGVLRQTEPLCPHVGWAAPWSSGGELDWEGVASEHGELSGPFLCWHVSDQEPVGLGWFLGFSMPRRL